MSLRANKAANYANRRIVFDGYVFDTQAECARWMELKLLAQVGEIQNLQRRVEYPLQVNGRMICSYTPDFRYEQDGKTIVEDVRTAPSTQVARIKAHLMKAIHGMEIKVT